MAPSDSATPCPQTPWKWVFFFLALITLGLFQSASTNLNGDQAHQLAAALSFLKGHSMSVMVGNPRDLSQAISHPWNLHPPGYSLLLAPLIKVLNDNRVAILILNLVTCVLLLSAWAFILESLGSTLGEKGRLSLWIFWALPGVLSLNSKGSNLTAFAFYSMGIALCLLAVRKKAHFEDLGLLSGVFMGLAAMTRYAYVPLLLVAPLCLTWCATKFNRQLLKTAMVNLATAGGIWLVTALYLRKIPDHLTPLYNLARPWQFRNILRMHPFPVDAIWFENAWNEISTGSLTTAGLWMVAGLLLGVFFFGSCTLIKNEKPAVAFFHAAGVMTVIFTVGMLIFLSSQSMVKHQWTHVMEPRYYLITHPFIAVVLAEMIIAKARGPFSKFSGLTKLAIAPLLLIALLNIPLNAKTLYRQFQDPKQSWFTGKYQKEFERLLQQSAPKSRVVYIESLSFTDQDCLMRNALAKLSGSPLLMTQRKFDLATSQPVDVVVGLPRKPSPRSEYLREFCREQNGVKVGEILDREFYAFTLMPGRYGAKRGS